MHGIDLNSLFPTYPHRCVSHSLVLATFTRSALSQLFFFALHHSMPRSDPIIFNSFPSIRTNVSSFDRFFAEANTVLVLYIFNFCSLFNLLLFCPCFCTWLLEFLLFCHQNSLHSFVFSLFFSFILLKSFFLYFFV